MYLTIIEYNKSNKTLGDFCRLSIKHVPNQLKKTN